MSFVELYPQPHKVAVLTGGNKGIGLAVLQKLLECEMTVIVGVRRPDECKQIVERTFLKFALKGRVVYEKLDVGDTNSVREFVQRISKKFPAVHVLINNGNDE
jgi:NAD(P)-dependent dehydrogenase (short-subunit alcohol dehydrogenase family)